MRLTGWHHAVDMVGQELDPQFRESPLLDEQAALTSQDLKRPDLWNLEPVKNQIAGNCVAHGHGASAWACAQAIGEPIPWPSVCHLYTVARLTAFPRRPLVDAGSSGRAMLQGMSDRRILATSTNAGESEGWGIVSAKDYPEIPENVDRIPPDDVWREGEGATVKSYSIILDTEQRGDEGVEAALRRNRYPTGCLFVDEAFGDMSHRDDAVYDQSAGTILGAHCVIFTGRYSASLDAFEIRNSWGVDWANAGYCWMSRRRVREQMFWRAIIEVSPAKLAERT